MIDWYSLVANSIWVLALALALSVISLASWKANLGGESLKDQLNRSSWGIPLNLAGVLFCLGLFATSETWWEKGLWVLVLFLFALQIRELHNRKN